MKIQCPHCGVKGSADDSYHGLKVKCPKCQGIFAAIRDAAVAPSQHPIPASLEPPEDVADGGPGQAALNDRPEPPGEEAAAEHLITAGPLADDTSAIAGGMESAVQPDEDLTRSDITSEIDRQIVEDETRAMGEGEGQAELAGFVEDDRMPAADPDLVFEENDRAAPGSDLSPATAIDATESSESPAPSSKTEEKGALLTAMDDEAVMAADGIERQPYGMDDKEQCWQCGKKDSIGVPFITKDGRLYCPDCVPAEELATAVLEHSGTIGPDTGLEENSDGSPEGTKYGFTIGGVLREAWAKTTGAKAAVWAGSAVMYLVLLALVAVGAVLLPAQSTTPGATGLAATVGEMLFTLVIKAVSAIFVAGLLFMGIRKVAGESISWKMVFRGGSVAGKIIVATILQTLLVGIGFLLLVLPGIYLAIGYAMTLPLIIDRHMSPWQAMEASRKAIHHEWWKIAGIFVVMGLIFAVSMVPLGIGIIWSWPMFVILGGVVYRSLFGIEKTIG